VTLVFCGVGKESDERWRGGATGISHQRCPWRFLRYGIVIITGTGCPDAVHEEAIIVPLAPLRKERNYMESDGG
jgi:hypothetical protein